MARHDGESPGLVPCSPAELQPRDSVVSQHPLHCKPVKFVNGFQKRLGVYKYKIGCHEKNSSSDSESDISSLEIDSNVSNSSGLSNPGSPHSSFLKSGDRTQTEKSKAGEGFNDVLMETHDHSLPNGRSSSCDHIDLKLENNNSLAQDLYNSKRIHRSADKFTLCLPKKYTPMVISESDRGSAVTATPKKRPANNHEKGRPLVLKIRRRTLAVSDNSHTYFQANPPKHESGSARTKSTSTLRDYCLQAGGVDGEWLSIIEAQLPESAKENGTTNADLAKTKNKMTMGASKRKHHHHHHHHKTKKSKSKRDFMPHGVSPAKQKGRRTKQHHKSKRKKLMNENGSKKHPISRPKYRAGETLTLPSDPRKAVKVLEKALESINAKINQLKRESEEEKRTNKSKRRGRHKKGSRKSRTRHKHPKGKGDEDNTRIGAIPLLPTVSQFKLSDSFTVVPSLIVRGDDLYPAYSASVDPVTPPRSGHPIWRWRLGQAPLPKSRRQRSNSDNRELDWL